MKIDTSPERIWITLESEEISSKLVFLCKHFWASQNVLLPHVHTSYEFIYIVGGQGSIRSRGIEYKLSCGDILVVEPNTEHEGVAHPENPFELFTMGYDFNRDRMQADPALFGVDRVFLRLYEVYTEKTQLPIIHDRHHIAKVLFTVIDEIIDTKLCREELIRNLAEFVDAKELSLDGKESVEKAKQFIRAHYSEPLTLEEISNFVCLSLSHFSRLFKNETTFTPIEYLKAVRIDYAKKFLIYSDLNLTEIAARVGFNSLHYFSHCFKKSEGISPLDYRRDKKRLLFHDGPEDS